MKRTYGFRRQDILDGAIATDDLFTIYPPLKDADEVVQCRRSAAHGIARNSVKCVDKLRSDLTNIKQQLTEQLACYQMPYKGIYMYMYISHLLY